jgi:hypothetical protein
MARQIAPTRISTIAGIIKAIANVPALGRIAANATAAIATSKPNISSLFGTERTAKTIRKLKPMKAAEERVNAATNSPSIRAASTDP